MSIRLMSEIWAEGPADGVERFVLLAIADHANDEGFCYPSTAGIAAKCCLDRRTVQRKVKALKEAGWLTIFEQQGPNGKNLLQVHFPDQGGAAQRRPPEEQGRQAAAGGAAHSRQGGGTAPPEPSSNHQLTVSGDAPARDANSDLQKSDKKAPAKETRKKRRTEIGYWQPDDQDRLDAALHMYGKSDATALARVEEVVDRFISHHQAQGSVMADWRAAWRTWFMRENDFKKRRG